MTWLSGSPCPRLTDRARLIAAGWVIPRKLRGPMLQPNAKVINGNAMTQSRRWRDTSGRPGPDPNGRSVCGIMRGSFLAGVHACEEPNRLVEAEVSMRSLRRRVEDRHRGRTRGRSRGSDETNGSAPIGMRRTVLKMIQEDNGNWPKEVSWTEPGGRGDVEAGPSPGLRSMGWRVTGPRPLSGRGHSRGRERRVRAWRRCVVPCRRRGRR